MKDMRTFPCASRLFRLEDVDVLADDYAPSGRHMRLSDDEDSAH